MFRSKTTPLALLFLTILLLGGMMLMQRLFRNDQSVLQTPLPTKGDVLEEKMQLTSSAFSNNQSIPTKYTCDGDNVNPPLAIADVPENTQSLVVIVDDPDAPAGDWVHWTLWNIDPQEGSITEDTLPEGAVEGMTDFGRAGYGGPCPPSGTHRYQFKLYALDIRLELSSEAKKSEIEQAMQGHILAQTQLTGLYQRK